jgi:hypothetical protein
MGWKKGAPRDPGLVQIDEWEAWFRNAHAQRLASAEEFPDRHLVESERVRIEAQITAMVAKMKEDLLIRVRQKRGA